MRRALLGVAIITWALPAYLALTLFSSRCPRVAAGYACRSTNHKHLECR